MAHATSFECVVAQALVSHPDDAHVFIERYLQRKNLSKDKTDAFRRAWAKVSLESRAFGAKGIAPEAFASELLAEITRTWNPTVAQMQHYAQQLQERSTRDNCDVISLYEEFQSLQNDIATKLRQVLDADISSRVYPPIADVIESAAARASVLHTKNCYTL